MMIFMMVLIGVRGWLYTMGRAMRVIMTEWLFDKGYIYISKWIPTCGQPGWLGHAFVSLHDLIICVTRGWSPFECIFVHSCGCQLDHEKLTV